MRAVLAENGWAGSVAVDVDVPPVVSDRRRLERVIVNLIGNALLHGGGRAEVSGRVEGDRLVLTVTDHGPGIPAGELESVFGRFAKAGGGEGGSGLGLAIAREHASALGGDVRVESEPGGRRGLLADRSCCRTVTRG